MRRLSLNVVAGEVFRGISGHLRGSGMTRTACTSSGLLPGAPLFRSFALQRLIGLSAILKSGRPSGGKAVPCSRIKGLARFGSSVINLAAASASDHSHESHATTIRCIHVRNRAPRHPSHRFPVVGAKSHMASDGPCQMARDILIEANRNFAAMHTTCAAGLAIQWCIVSSRVSLTLHADMSLSRNQGQILVPRDQSVNIV